MLAKVLSRPVLSEEAEPYYRAFMALMRDRPMLGGGMVVLPLPLPRDLIERHLRRIGVDKHEIAEFVEIVARIDDLYIKQESERVLADLKKPRGKKG